MKLQIVLEPSEEGGYTAIVPALPGCLSLRARAAQQDAQAVREILLETVDSTVEGLLRISSERPQAAQLPALLDKIAAGFRDAPALSDEAVSRAGIYADHP